MFKSGFVSILGETNVGKSTLLNTILGKKVSIVTAKPQTTRNNIIGIKNLENGQIIFVDTPGICRAKTSLSKIMVKSAISKIYDCDLIYFMIETRKNPEIKDEEENIIRMIENSKKKVFLLINKIDLFNKGFILPLTCKFHNRFKFEEIFPISALYGEGIEKVLLATINILPSGTRYYPEDMITAMESKFQISEIIREKTILLTRQEVPYAIGVIVDKIEEDVPKNLLKIYSTIFVEKDSQKGIIIGNKGSMIKKIGILSREELEFIMRKKIYLNLFVKVEADWTKDEKEIKKMGLKY